MGPRKSEGYKAGQLSDSDWEADDLPLNYTRKSGSYVSLRLTEHKSESTRIVCVFGVQREEAGQPLPG